MTSASNLDTTSNTATPIVGAAAVTIRRLHNTETIDACYGELARYSMADAVLGSNTTDLDCETTSVTFTLKLPLHRSARTALDAVSTTARQLSALRDMLGTMTGAELYIRSIAIPAALNPAPVESEHILHEMQCEYTATIERTAIQTQQVSCTEKFFVLAPRNASKGALHAALRKSNVLNDIMHDIEPSDLVRSGAWDLEDGNDEDCTLENVHLDSMQLNPCGNATGVSIQQVEDASGSSRLVVVAGAADDETRLVVKESDLLHDDLTDAIAAALASR